MKTELLPSRGNDGPLFQLEPSVGKSPERCKIYWNLTNFLLLKETIPSLSIFLDSTSKTMFITTWWEKLPKKTLQNISSYTPETSSGSRCSPGDTEIRRWYQPKPIQLPLTQVKHTGWQLTVTLSGLECHAQKKHQKIPSSTNIKAGPLRELGRKWTVVTFLKVTGNNSN